jgi:hypothetical protein
MDALLLAGLLGGFGGAVRATVGMYKSLAVKKRVYWRYWILTCILAIIIGFFVGMLFDFDYKVSLLVGYAGTDLLEGLYKSMSRGKGFVVVK